MNPHTARRRFCNERTSEMEWIAITRMGAEYLQMAMFKVGCNRAVDKVPGFWKTEWINRKRGGISGRRDSPEIFYDIGTGRFDLEKQPRNGKKKGTWVFARVPFFFFSQRGISRRISVFSCVSCISWFIPSLLLPLDGSPLQSVHALLSLPPYFQLSTLSNRLILRRLL